jgi:hypothetical protein
MRGCETNATFLQSPRHFTGLVLPPPEFAGIRAQTGAAIRSHLYKNVKLFQRFPRLLH